MQTLNPSISSQPMTLILSNNMSDMESQLNTINTEINKYESMFLELLKIGETY